MTDSLIMLLPDFWVQPYTPWTNKVVCGSREWCKRKWPWELLSFVPGNISQVVEEMHKQRAQESAKQWISQLRAKSEDLDRRIEVAFPRRAKIGTEECKLRRCKTYQCKFELQLFDIAELHKLVHIEFRGHWTSLTVFTKAKVQPVIGTRTNEFSIVTWLRKLYSNFTSFF